MGATKDAAILRRDLAATRPRGSRLPMAAVRRGVPPGWFGWRWVPEILPDGPVGPHDGIAVETLHPVAHANYPLPRNVASAEELYGDAGWWGFSMREVPARTLAPTFQLTLKDALITSFDEPTSGNFYPAILTRTHLALRLREMVFRGGHAMALRSAAAPVTVPRGAWIAERVYHNHAHWVTAHLPKLCLLEEMGLLGDLILPRRRGAVIDACVELFGVDPASCVQHDPSRPLRVGELTVFSTDRFRPELVSKVRSRLGRPASRPHRNIFISRAKVHGRSVHNAAELERVLERFGYEPVVMESLPFAEQIALMGETRRLLAPHGAGLSNMMFCAPGTDVIEISEPSFPNPNFYALASALELNYWITKARYVGPPTGYAVNRELEVDADGLARLLADVEAAG
ncbi:glycosyltransferase family 61 protein [Acuticoccus sp.]|uniref:glycosyltransferase family 61 protein n=1 Tax=Acuticoccus sp. TaxID=1904378 RepID=UPI003B526407